MSLNKTQIALLGVGLLILIVVVLIFMRVLPGLRSDEAVGLEGSLTVWGVFDSKDLVEETLIADFVAANPKAVVTYRQFDPRTYEAELLNALAAGAGPDVFMVQNTWIPKYADKLLSVNPAQFATRELDQLFPKVVAQDFAPTGVVYALPLYIDTLATFYNRALLDGAVIAQPPQTWEDFTAIVPSLRRVDQAGRITRAAAAIGGSNRNIDRATDLLSLILLQQGVAMVDDTARKATFANDGAAQRSLEFFTQFGRTTSAAYTWDPGFSQSIDAFSQGQVAIIFNYAYQMEFLKEKNPFLDFAVAPMLQFEQASVPVNYASYWGLAVSKQTRQPGLAWTFIQNSTLNPDVSEKYLETAGRSPALRALLTSKARERSDLAIFADQALTSTSWHQVDNTAVDDILSKMLESIIQGQLTVDRALRQAQEQVTVVLGTSRLGLSSDEEP